MTMISIISRQCIKPSSPTPPHLKTFKFSFLDQLMPAIHGNITLFFPSSTTLDFSNKSLLLQESLSNTLTLFYPLAGRLTNATTVDCNDEGVIFVEAHINIQLSEFLKQPDFNLIDHFLPTSDPKTMEMSNGAMFLVRLTSFTCGGIAIGMSLSHKLADLSAFLTVIQSWASTCGQREQLVPDLVGDRLLPPRDDLPDMSASLNIAVEKFEARRFVVSAAKIAKLKAKFDATITERMHRPPSRVEIVLALLWKCAISANKSKSGSFKPSAMFQAVNLRKRMSPPLPDTTMGNFIWPFMVLVQDEKDLDICELVIKMRKAFNDFCDDKANKFKGEENVSTILGALKERGEFFKNNKDINVYKCSSSCKYPLFDTDFGWGKPLWNVSVNKMVSNTIFLADTITRDGIDATVTLDVEEMAIFEADEELLQYASVNPSAYVRFRNKL